jgi:hypothetical protein
MPLQLRDKRWFFIPELTINAQRLRAKTVQHPFFRPQTVRIFAQIQTLVHQYFEPKSPSGGPRPDSSGKSYPPKAYSVLPFSNSILDFSFCLFLFLIGSSHWDFGSRREPITILFPRACGNLRPFWVHWSRISKNPFQSSLVETPWMARCFQRLAPAPNCRSEKLVQEDAWWQQC